jgi:hypothetical protein
VLPQAENVKRDLVFNPSRLHSKKIDSDFTSIDPAVLRREYQSHHVGATGDVGW